MSKTSRPLAEPRTFQDHDQDLEPLRLTPGQWRTILESENFLERADNRFQHPRRFHGAPVQIIPDESFREAFASPRQRRTEPRHQAAVAPEIGLAGAGGGAHVDPRSSADGMQRQRNIVLEAE